jgi:hypothetical protein
MGVKRFSPGRCWGTRALLCSSQLVRSRARCPPRDGRPHSRGSSRRSVSREALTSARCPRDLNRREALARIRRLLHTGAYTDLRLAASAGSEDASLPTRPAPLPRLPLLGRSRSQRRPRQRRAATGSTYANVVRPRITSGRLGQRRSVREAVPGRRGAGNRNRDVPCGLPRQVGSGHAVD